MVQAQQKNSKGKTVILGIQHVFAMFGSTVLVPLLTGIDPSLALLCAGLGTLLFHFVTGRKVPAFLGSSFAFISAIQVVAGQYGAPGTAGYSEGLQYACGGIIVAGVLYVLLAGLVKLFGAERIRSFFPPVITGPMVMIIGLMLAPTAINNITTAANGAALEGADLWLNWLVALVTILTMFIVSLYCKGFFKLVPILFGIAAGYITSLIITWCGHPMVDFTSIQNAAWIAAPKFMLPKFALGPIITIAPLAIVTFVEHIGDMQANGSVVGKDFFKDPGLHRTLLGDGLATIMAGFMGGPANTTYSENTGVLAATKNYNPVTLEIAAVFAILMGFVGKFSGFLSSLPRPVMGGVSIILFGMIAAVGLRTLVENQVDFKNSRNLMIVAVMLVLGLGGAAFQFAFNVFGEHTTISFSGAALAAVVGIILNKALPEKVEKEEA